MDHYGTLSLTHHFFPPLCSQRKWEKQLTLSGSANTINTFFYTSLISCQAQEYAHALCLGIQPPVGAPVIVAFQARPFLLYQFCSDVNEISRLKQRTANIL